MTIEVPELAPCPFCGGEARIVSGDEAAYVQCEQVKMHRALWFQGDNAAADIVRDEWNRRAQPIPGTVGVEAIKWGTTSYGDPEARTIIDSYRLSAAANGGWCVVVGGLGGHVLHGPDGRENFATLDEAKAAAQADYERLILSCLTQGSQP